MSQGDSSASKESGGDAPPSGVGENHVYVTPERKVRMSDMQLWQKSEAYLEYVGFILAMNEAARGRSNSSVDTKSTSPVVANILKLLDKLGKMIDDTPPVEQPQRFGNQAFRHWMEKLKDNVFALLQDVLPKHLHAAVPEVMAYFMDSFGNFSRIDYGTGHEIAFIMFLCCLFKIGALGEADKPAVPCKLFARYLEIVRKLQQSYRMEPAGSHGVWSLDDYQFVPFIWGSSQLIDHPRIEPPSFLQQDIVNTYADEYLFLGCIKYIDQVKTGPFAEHSNQLWGISGVSSWSKVNAGLIKMYKVEVLGKHPVVQHILFGSLLSLKLADPSVQEPGAKPQRSSLMQPFKVPGHSLPEPTVRPSKEGQKQEVTKTEMLKTEAEKLAKEAERKSAEQKKMEKGGAEKKEEDAVEQS